ncbi:MAG: holo-ACP synthase [Myxococcaceae bacterium]|nr:holo-ACP synthase [Myxococcaceae bacterium]
MPVVGLGMDVCSVARVQKILEGPRGARFVERVFTEAERAICSARADAASAYAARFAAKEALVKALGAPPSLSWQDMEVVRDGGAPGFKLSGVAAQEVARRGVSILLSMTHDAGVAAATVILQRD